MIDKNIEMAKKHFGKIIEEQLERIEMIKQKKEWINYQELKPIFIGIIGGDRIESQFCKHANKLLEFILKDEIENMDVKIINIKEPEIENHVELMNEIPNDVLEEIKKCDVILKVPTINSNKMVSSPKIGSINNIIKKELDLFVNIVSVKNLKKGLDWIFFRENTEGFNLLGNKGLDVTDDLSIDFTVITEQGAERIIRAAFDYAKKNNKNKVTIVTKANVVKKTDGRFLRVAEKLSKEYPDIEWDDWFIDMTIAKMIDPITQKDFKVIILPNLYGDICTEEAMQIQKGIGIAGSANIGNRYAMFEALHGFTQKTAEEEREKYADPSSIIKASSMLLNHIGYTKKAIMLEKALDICKEYEKKVNITGGEDGVTGEEYVKYILNTFIDTNLEEKWNNYQK